MITVTFNGDGRQLAQDIIAATQTSTDIVIQGNGANTTLPKQ